MGHSRQEQPFRAGPPACRRAWVDPRTTERPIGENVPVDTPEQYAARDAACYEWVERVYGGIVSPRERMIAETAFAAGWSARKHAQYQALVNVCENKSRG